MSAPDLSHVPACHRSAVLRGLIATQEERVRVLYAAADEAPIGSCESMEALERWFAALDHLAALLEARDQAEAAPTASTPLNHV